MTAMATDPSETFRQEAQELLEQLEQALLDLEHAPDDTDLIDTAFRALHTIKGSGAMFGFDAVAAFTHHVETAFDLVRKGEMAPTRELIAVALAAKDQMRRLIEQPATVSAGAGEAILSDLRRLMEAVTGPVAKAESDWRIRFRLPKDAMATGTNPLLLLDELRSLGTAHVIALTDDVPLLEEIDPGTCYIRWDVTLQTTHPRSAIDEVFLFVLDDMELNIEPIAAAENLAEHRSDPPKPAAVAPALQQPPTPSATAEDPPAEKTVPAAAAQQSDPHNAKTVSTIRVPAERLDELMDRVGELVIAQTRLAQLSSSVADLAIKSVAEEIERLSAGLRDITMGIRMVPIGSLFGRFRRLVHDLSRDLGKPIELVTTGEETELDKTMIERLADPLVHLIRNAADHGLETPDMRAASGKPATGRIQLIAHHAGAQVHITITDDGRGLDRDRIRAKVEQQGLVAPDATLTDNELFQFLFHAGFSTAREVTALSGRGVGMDVVKRAIEGLRGTIDLSTNPGKGTEVTLRLPLTLAIIDGLLVRVGDARYVIALSAVEECVELPAAEDARTQGRSFLNIRGDLVPFLRLRTLFNATTPPDPYQKIVVVASGDLRVGLAVDQIIGSHQTVIKSLPRLHADVAMFSGATILGDGTVALILDVAELVSFGQLREERARAS
ncbi:MAG: chemotaxis protein CheA [Acetobacteraceae bacterium]|nr:chemotaxis protein CheA [Acetobacteraceae bacterium]